MQPVADLASRRWFLLLSAMVSFFAVGMTFFAVPPLVGALKGAFALSNLQIGLLMGGIAGPAIFLSVPLGVAVDRWDPRRAGLAGLVTMLAGSIVFSTAPSFAVLVGGRLLFGVGALVVNLLLARLLSLAFAGRELAAAMGLFTATYPASMIVLFSAHSALERALGWRLETGLLALLVVLAIPLHVLAVPARGQGTPVAAVRLNKAALPPPLVALGIAWMLYFAAFAAVPTFGPEWAGGGESGLLLTSLITWVALVGTPLSGAFIDKIGYPHLWCLSGLAVLTLTLALMGTGAMPAPAAMLAVGLVAGVASPAVYALPARLVPAERVGLAFGFITALSNLGTVVGPALAGWVRDATPSWGPLWLTLAAIALVGTAATAFIRVPGRPEHIS
jgi:NNP family nitrate/nitrite transporter-like MFS transporter